MLVNRLVIPVESSVLINEILLVGCLWLKKQFMVNNPRMYEFLMN